MKILVALILVHRSQAYLITEAKPGVVVVPPGDRVTLFCAVDDDYGSSLTILVESFVILSGR